ncbi:MAG: carbohydrate ABC transporter permease [Trueperaceae bacterium]|nr:MAG: carbohydrate ABC transporter permease [Trueperaceae bacterium]
MRYRFRKTLLRALRALALTIACVVVLVPLSFLAVNSVKYDRDFITVPPKLIPSEITFEHYRDVFSTKRTVRIFRNSLIVASVTTLITVVFGTMAAYGLARLGLSARLLGLIVFIFLFIRFYPRITTVIPYFLVMRQFDMLDTVWAIIIGHLGITIPFVAWLMLIVFRELPIEVEEAAVVDGANPWQRFSMVVLPMTAPGVASAAILTAILSWNEFLIAASIARRKASVLSIGVASYITDQGVQWGEMSALGVIMIVPMVLFALSVQRYLIRGITLGAVKG